MKTSLACLLLILLSASLCLTGCSTRVYSPLRILPEAEETEVEETVVSEDFHGLGVLEPEGFVFSGRVFLVGDSTVAGHYEPTKAEALDLMGWGKYLDYYFKPEEKEFGVDGVSVYNYALSGRSARSFAVEESYEKVFEKLGSGDYLFIQFGHNDQHVDDWEKGASATLSRHEVDPETGKNDIEMYSFEWVLYNRYVRPALERDAVPVLISPTARLDAVSGQADVQAHLPYRDVMKALAEEFSVPFIDLTGLSEELYRSVAEQEGAAGTSIFHAFTTANHTEIDTTHLSRYGAYRVAGLVAGAVAESETALAHFVVGPEKEILPRS